MFKSYVIRAGRCTAAQKKAYEAHCADFLIPVSDDKLVFSDFFKNDNLTVEIGFGSGFATAEIAQANPDKNYLGIEVHKPGIGRLLWEIENRNLSNIRIIEYDAVQVFEKMIPSDSLDAIHIFFPDPWPKKRHRKRRLIQRPFTNILASCLKAGGYLYMVTDWEDYAAHALEELTLTDSLKNMYDDFAPIQSWRPKTRFENKGLEKEHKINEIYFTRRLLCS
ncbi:MAG: tRNA (guanosine(46)-N7)-methyltransferase TrmB [Treponema sp.]|nr:tRNA (guanosine(46)-N7)-methyltransferase TrmB [Treponema sp.]